MIIVDFPDPALFYQNTTFAEAGDVGFVPSFDNDVLWSFSFTDGHLLDPDGLALPAPGTASDGFLFAGDLLVIPGWFPTQGVFIADVSNPAGLREHGHRDREGTDSQMSKHLCIFCGYVYDPENGDPDSGIAPGTRFEDLPDDWVCPVCGAFKDGFEPTG